MPDKCGALPVRALRCDQRETNRRMCRHGAVNIRPHWKCTRCAAVAPAAARSQSAGTRRQMMIGAQTIPKEMKGCVVLGDELLKLAVAGSLWVGERSGPGRPVVHRVRAVVRDRGQGVLV